MSSAMGARHSKETSNWNGLSKRCEREKPLVSAGHGRRVLRGRGIPEGAWRTVGLSSTVTLVTWTQAIFLSEAGEEAVSGSASAKRPRCRRPPNAWRRQRSCDARWWLVEQHGARGARRRGVGVDGVMRAGARPCSVW